MGAWGQTFWELRVLVETRLINLLLGKVMYSSQVDVLELGRCQDSVLKPGAQQVGALELGALQVSAPELRLQQDSVLELGALQDGVLELRVPQVSAWELRVPQDGVLELRVRQVSALELRVPQVSALELRVLQVGVLEIRYTGHGGLILSLVNAPSALGDWKRRKVTSKDSCPLKRGPFKIGAAQIGLREDGIAKIGTTEVPIGEDEPRDLFQPLRALTRVWTAQCRDNLRGGFPCHKHLLLEP